jgi:glycosyltransferase involved in cell wall biosynthesis
VSSKKVSVILPVYNGSKLLNRCLDSILNQLDFSPIDIELIAINDGSTDRSLEILQSYKKKYPRTMTVIDQENMGAASTRNSGIQTASAPYVTLIDQDDFIDDRFIATLYRTIIESDAEIVQSGYKLVSSNGEIKSEIFPVCTEFGRYLAIPAWAKLYKTEFLRQNQVLFFANNIGEDSIFTLRVLQTVSRYMTIQYAGYNNSYDNDTNVTNTLHKGLSDKVNIIQLLAELQKIMPAEGIRARMHTYNIIRTAAYYLLSYGRYASPQRFTEVSAILYGWIKQNIHHFAINKYLYIPPRGEKFSAFMGIQLFLIINRVNLVHLFAKLYCKGKSYRAS